MENIDTTTLLKELKKLNKRLDKNAKNITNNTKRKEGTYQLNKNGTARLQYMLDGQRYSDTVKASSVEEAEKKLTLFIETIKKGLYIKTNYTVTEFAQVWLDESVRPNADENNCVRSYLCYLNNRILPELGHLKLQQLTKPKLESYFNQLKKSKTMYKNRENTTLKPDTIKKIKKMINAMLNYAVACDLLLKNPCKYVRLTEKGTNDLNTIKNKANKKNNKINYFNKKEYKVVCNYLEKEIKEYYDDTQIENEKRLREVGRRIIVLLDLKTGMRRSELFGLAKGNGFNDLDLKNKTFNVNKGRHYGRGVGRYTKAPKNESSIRIKSLPSSIIPFLQLYFDLLNELNYTNMYIFDHLSIDGTCSWWNRWQDKHKIRNIRFHDIRHTHPTLLLAEGVDIKTISERLGHSDIKTTMNIYADVLKELDISASEKIDNI